MHFSSLFIGGIIGFYLAQNYDLPDIDKAAKMMYEKLKELEKSNKNK